MPKDKEQVYIVVCNYKGKPFKFGQSDCFDGVFTSKERANGYVKAMNVGSDVIEWRVFEESVIGDSGI
jgi:hypothetical protein